MLCVGIYSSEQWHNLPSTFPVAEEKPAADPWLTHCPMSRCSKNLCGMREYTDDLTPRTGTLCRASIICPLCVSIYREEPSRAVSFLWPRLRGHLALHVSYPMLYEHTYYICRCVCITYGLLTTLVAQSQKHLSQIVPHGQQSASCIVLAQAFLWGYSPMAGATVILTRRS